MITKALFYSPTWLYSISIHRAILVCCRAYSPVLSVATSTQALQKRQSTPTQEDGGHHPLLPGEPGPAAVSSHHKEIGVQAGMKSYTQTVFLHLDIFTLNNL